MYVIHFLAVLVHIIYTVSYIILFAQYIVARFVFFKLLSDGDGLDPSFCSVNDNNIIYLYRPINSHKQFYIQSKKSIGRKKKP